MIIFVAHTISRKVVKKLLFSVFALTGTTEVYLSDWISICVLLLMKSLSVVLMEFRFHERLCPADIY